MAGAGALRQDFAEGIFGRRPVGRADDVAALGIARTAGARGADAFRGADRHPARHRLRGRAGTDHCGPLAGTFWAQHPPVDCERRDAAGAGAVVAGAPPGAGDARPAGFLARQLCGGAFRPARALSAPSLAGGSRKRNADPPGETAGNLIPVRSLAPLFAERGEESPTINASLILFVKIAPLVLPVLAVLRLAWSYWRPRIECGVMRNIMIFAAIMVGLGTFMAQIADKMTPQAASAHVASKTVDTVGQSDGRSLSIPRDGRGHFLTEARIEGQRIGFMVDTGASVIALNETSAAQFGLRPSRGDYNATVSTANGTIKGARTRLAVVDVGGLIVRDVDAMVLPDEALSENLLGLSFLSKLKRFEYANGRMVLEQ